MAGTSTFISEKAAEILFNRFMLQWLGLRGAQLFAPTTRREYDSGYDGKVVGFGAMRELYLQFKAPTLSERDRRFTAKLDTRQHGRLLRYPPGTAYYVVGMFPSLTAFNLAQAEVGASQDFLRHFLCVDAAAVPRDARSLNFGIPDSHAHSPNPGYKDPRHGRGPTDYEALAATCWMRGNVLVDKLKNSEVGRVVQFGAEGSAAEATTAIGRADELSDNDCQGMGTFVRIPLPASS